MKKAPLPPSGESGSPASSPSHGRFSGDSFSQSHNSDHGHVHTRVASNHRKTNSMDTNLELGAVNSPLSSSSSNASPPHNPLYPSLPANAKEHSKDIEIGFDKLMSKENIKDPGSPFPVPAPRTLKPAVPNKPEGISR